MGHLKASRCRRWPHCYALAMGSERRRQLPGALGRGIAAAVAAANPEWVEAAARRLAVQFDRSDPRLERHSLPEGAIADLEAEAAAARDFLVELRSSARLAAPSRTTRSRARRVVTALRRFAPLLTQVPDDLLADAVPEDMLAELGLSTVEWATVAQQARQGRRGPRRRPEVVMRLLLGLRALQVLERHGLVRWVNSRQRGPYRDLVIDCLGVACEHAGIPVLEGTTLDAPQRDFFKALLLVSKKRRPVSN